jgi:hypothetical protein
MQRLFLCYLITAACGCRSADSFYALTDGGFPENDTTPQERINKPETTQSTKQQTSMILIPSLPCATDNPCLVAHVSYTGACTLKIVDQQGTVPCNDHNPCTTEDQCYNEYCLGEVIDGCRLHDAAQ